MASTSVSSLIMFIAAMLIAVSVAGTMVTNVGEVSSSIDAKSADAAQKIDTEVDIISDPGSAAVYDDGSGTITLLVKNTGNGRLPNATSNVDVLVDGQYVSDGDRSLTVVDGAEWRPGNVARLDLDRSLSAGSHRVVVIVNGDEEVFEFYV
ncbi:flagellar protein G [Haloarchaeobius amylolyticus]|uniref:flagellar protein G n=1 Tax=Haloarchaeobius amylolyticus TaxID=1198296 RepID=UPI00226D4482|nr:flagellar protein G [Haloarchaeobius amylolyticus]